MLLLLTPVTYYGFFAYVRHEHFYHGLPSSYWLRVLQAYDGPSSTSLTGIPALDTVCSYFGLNGRPPILRRDTAAIPVLLDLVSAAEGRARYRAATALARNVWSDGPIGELEARPLAVQSKGGRFVVLVLQRALLMNHEKEEQTLLLLDPNGQLLDTLSCLSRSESWGLETEVCEDSEEDGANVVIRGIGSDDSFVALITHGMAKPRATFDLPLKEWKRKGVCRLAIRGGGFDVLWPSLREPL
jgi:hypothetical protein